ncbi:MAG TPA: hypothetical protein VFX63_17170 [Pyrinomonadaceae bacterium]|nr:hypothetical protein [Pyrinomonadaceae bacterium]
MNILSRKKKENTCAGGACQTGIRPSTDRIHASVIDVEDGCLNGLFTGPVLQFGVKVGFSPIVAAEFTAI